MPRARPMGGVMFDERVIMVSNDAASGGISGEEYVPGTGTWTPIAAPSISAPDSAALIFNGGQNMLVAGGFRRPDVYFASAEAYKLNHRPLAVATIANPTTQAVPGSLAGVNVSAAGSTDADADHLTYTWTAGNTVLARTTDPTLSATLGLAIGSHTITLTVSDIFGETSTATVTASVTDGTGGTADLIRALQEELRQARSRATACELAIGTADTAAEIALRLQSGDASFRLPGPTPALKLGAFVVAALTTPSSCQKSMYRTLGGRK